MNYVISDIHGRLDLFEKMLDKIGFSENDTLFVLGDCIDRGGGLKVALKLAEMSKKGSVKFIMGNHEESFLSYCRKHRSDRRIKSIVEEIDRLNKENGQIARRTDSPRPQNFLGIAMVMKDVIQVTKNAEKMKRLHDEVHQSLRFTAKCSDMDECFTWEDMSTLTGDELSTINSFFASASMYEIVEINGQQYLLIHGGLADSDMKSLWIREDFYGKPVDKKLLNKYGAKDDCIVIFGHTTTRDINIELNGRYIAPNKIWYDDKYKDKIGIDCGACFPNGQLACLRLEDMKEFYVTNNEKFIVPLKELNRKIREIKDVFRGISEEPVQPSLD